MKKMLQLALSVSLALTLAATISLGFAARVSAEEAFVITDAFDADPRCEGTCVFDVATEGEQIKATVAGDCAPKLSMNLDELLKGKGPQTTRCNGTTHIYHGKVDLGAYVFDSDNENPLTFQIDKQKGYVYKKGKGVVTVHGKKISLPRS